MALANFSDLKSAIQDWSDRTDLSGKMDDFVTLADVRIRKDLARHEIRVRDMETRSDLTISSGTVTLPDDFMAMKAVQIRASNPTVATYRPMSWLNEAYPAGDEGTTAYYGIEGGTLYTFPLSTSNVRIVYWAYPGALTSSNTTNWLMTKYPDVYLYAGLVEVSAYTHDSEMLSHWVQMLTASFDGLKDASFGALMAHSPTMGASAYPT